MAIQVHRREFIFALGGAATAWSRKARAQGKRRVPKVGVLWHAGSAEEEGPLAREHPHVMPKEMGSCR